MVSSSLKKSSDSALKEWITHAETIEVKKNLQYFRQSAGLKVDKTRLASLESQSLEHSNLFLRKFGKEPRPLFVMSVDAIGRAKTYKLQVALHEARASKIISKKYKIGKDPVNWGSWRQFAAKTDDSKARKELFDDFVSKSAILTPLIRSRFEGYSKVLAKYGTDPLSHYLELERINYESLTVFVDRLGTSLKPAFRESLQRYSREILGREAEYFDDYYFFRSRIFRKYEKSFPAKAEPVSKIVRTMKEMGLDASKVKVDDGDRKGKSSSAFCFSIKVPTDVRICYRKSNPLENFSGVYHEFGHGVHGVSIDKAATFWDKYLIAMGVSEIFSIFFEGLMHNELYLKEELGLDSITASDIISRFRFNELYFATFYSANSMMKLRFWREGLTMEQADALYADLIEKYMGTRYPGKYWQLHHVMPEYFLYSPSYLIAAVRAYELEKTLTEMFGERYWKDRNAGKYVYELLRVGQSIDVSTFSRLDADAFAAHLKE